MAKITSIKVFCTSHKVASLSFGLAVRFSKDTRCDVSRGSKNGGWEVEGKEDGCEGHLIQNDRERRRPTDTVKDTS